MAGNTCIVRHSRLLTHAFVADAELKHLAKKYRSGARAGRKADAMRWPSGIGFKRMRCLNVNCAEPFLQHSKLYAVAHVAHGSQTQQKGAKGVGREGDDHHEQHCVILRECRGQPSRYLWRVLIKCSPRTCKGDGSNLRSCIIHQSKHPSLQALSTVQLD